MPVLVFALLLCPFLDLKLAHPSQFEARDIATIPEGVKPFGPVKFGSDGKHVAYVVHVPGDQYQVYWNDRPGRIFNMISNLVMSPDGRRAVYHGINWTEKMNLAKSEHFLIVVDDSGERIEYQSPPRTDGKIGMLEHSPAVFSPDGKDIAYVISEGRKVVVGNSEGISVNWMRLIIAGKTHSADYGDIGSVGYEPPTWSPDSKYVGFAAFPLGRGEGIRILSAEEAGYFLVTLQNPSGSKSPKPASKSPVERVGALKFHDFLASPSFSADGKHVVSWGVNHGKDCLVIDDKKQSFPNEGIASPAITKDGKTVYHKLKTDEKWYMANLGKPVSEGYSKLGDPVLSPDEKQLAFVAVTGGKATLEHPGLFGLKGSLHYHEGGTWRVVLNGEEKEPFHRIPFDPVFSHDASRLAYVGVRIETVERWSIVVGSQQSEAFEETSAPIFSPDGKKIAFGALKGRQLSWQVLDVQE